MKEEFDEHFKRLETKIRSLDDRFTEQKTRLSDLRKSLTMLRDEVSLLTQQIEAGARGSQMKSESAPAQPSSAREAASLTQQLSAEELYEHAYSNFMERNYEAAIRGFQAFVERYPGSDLADNAQYWVGESNLLLQRYEQASVAFQLVLEKFPKGNKLPDALYKKGFSLFHLGRFDAALTELYTLLQRYPASGQANRARKLIERIVAER
ncbi:MAG: tol-pal system protein YbgF [Candidatus Tectomicrobia bacterium]|nr:tol-pal system protein YbgF [Candidatus Tectomicrobia bacterium]